MAKKTGQAKSKGGRPTKYRASYAEDARKLCSQFGADDKALAEYFGVVVRTIDGWKKSHPEFLQALKTGKDEYDTKSVEDSLLRRATGYKYKEVHLEVDMKGRKKQKVVTKEVPPDVTACIFWLKNRNIVRWRNNPEEYADEDAGPTRIRFPIKPPVPQKK